jgi:hypothetical protein
MEEMLAGVEGMDPDQQRQWNSFTMKKTISVLEIQVSGPQVQ